jgi:serine/threonine-protein kinase
MAINRKLGDYILVDRLASGGQSEVFLAVKQGPGDFTRPLVIKALPSKYRRDRQFVELFEREAFLSARFDHPNVVSVHDARRLEGEHCMVMDFIAGQTVADFAEKGFKRGRPPELMEAVHIIADACEGLAYAHDFTALDGTTYPVVHRDISPQNLMVTYQGYTVVFDFGIAKVVDQETSIDTLAGGKYAYMSPEQCHEERTVDTRSDIFSLGVILYELTLGERLFRRESRDQVIEAVTDATIEAPVDKRDDYPEPLNDIVMRALERDPDDRYQAADAMARELWGFLRGAESSPSRAYLGGVVREMFQEERDHIAQSLSGVDPEKHPPAPVGSTPLEKLGGEAISQEASDVAVPMPEPSTDDQLQDGAGDEETTRALREVRSRQQWLWVALVIISIAAIVFAVLAFAPELVGVGGPVEPIEIGQQ